jgi:hypothetical protein
MKVKKNENLRLKAEENLEQWHAECRMQEREKKLKP